MDARLDCDARIVVAAQQDIRSTGWWRPMAGSIDERLAPILRARPRWRELRGARRLSFFQSWTWTAVWRLSAIQTHSARDPRRCRRQGSGFVEPAPVLPELSCLWLARAAPEVRQHLDQHMGLLAGGPPARPHNACLRAARTAPIAGAQPLVARRLMLSGIPDTGVYGRCRIGRPARLQPGSALYRPGSGARQRCRLSGKLSANTRQQLRRSDRAYAAIGPLALRRAESVAEAHQFLDALASLHQARWNERGRSGAFAGPFFRRFHRALIERGLPRGEIDLLRIAAGQQVIGYLYNFRYRGHALAYQSGFDYLHADKHQKPGLTCHHAAIRQYLADGIDRYDFLAGDDRYKRSLSTGMAVLHWLEIGAPWAPRRVLSGLRQRCSRLDQSGCH